MPLVNQSDVSDRTISYATWKIRAEFNRVWYVEIPNSTPAPTYVAAFGKLGLILLTKITESADITDFETIFQPSAGAVTTELELYEVAAADAVIGRLDGRQQKAYDISETTIYIGFAEFGVLQSEAAWTIKRLTLDSSGNPTSEQWTGVEEATWTNRTLETYR
jgi:hypothetical protein